MGPFFGVLLHAVGGYAAGSFYIPFRKVQRWAWESYWLIQGVAAWVVMPWVAGLLTIPNLTTVLRDSPFEAKLWAFIFGALWGIGGLTFGLSMRYLGMSLGYAVSLGFCAAGGTLIPPLFKGELGATASVLSGQVTLFGMLVCLAGIAVCGYAGICKERELSDQEKHATIKEFDLVKGYAVAVFAGVMSACMAFAITAGAPIAKAAVAAGAADIYQTNASYVPIMAGGFATNLIWCVILNLRHKSIRDYVTGPGSLLRQNYSFASMAGIIWFLQFFFYGMGQTRMGAYSFASWTIHMAFIIAFSNMWGLFFKEWKGSSRRTLTLVWLGIGVLVLSTVVVGYGNYLKGKEAPAAARAVVRMQVRG